MTQTPPPETDTSADLPGAPAFAALCDALAALSHTPRHEVTAGHLDIGPGLWLSCDPGGRARMSLAGGDGFTLELERGDSGRWACLGLRLDPEILRGGRYLGVLIEARCQGSAVINPVLRYLPARGPHHDTGPDLPMVMAPGPQSCLRHIAIAPDRLADIRDSELNLFFQTDRAELHITKLEPLLMR